MLALMLTGLLGCSDVEDAHDHDHDHNHGVIHAVDLAFTPQSGGDTAVFSIDEDVVDDVVLTAGEVYDLTVTFYEEDGETLIDMTDEIIDDAESHQVFFLGDGVDSEATGTSGGVLSIAYADADASGLPIGLNATATGAAAGAAELRVVLRHMPPENDVAVKTETTAADVAAGGLSAIGGDSDADVTFSVTVE